MLFDDVHDRLLAFLRSRNDFTNKQEQNTANFHKVWNLPEYIHDANDRFSAPSGERLVLRMNRLNFSYDKLVLGQ
jgi:hypothetical protein